jgi:hypothetical protein
MAQGRLTLLVPLFDIWQLVVTSVKQTFTSKQLVDTTMVLALTQCMALQRVKVLLLVQISLRLLPIKL